jgi:hypothetical protein
MKIDFKTCTEKELWEFVASHLKLRGVSTVLVGGAVVSIYTDGAYQSGDLDFILTDLFVKKIPEIMKDIGFEKRGGRHYVHPECSHLYVEFPKGPLEIGDDTDIVPDEITVDGVTIKILSPTDCVKDRLATYIYFKDRVGMDQALLVARQHPVNFEKIKDWCVKENAAHVFDEFHNYLKK